MFRSMRFWSRTGGAVEARGRIRDGVKSRPRVESLEGRAVLSGAGVGAAHHVAAAGVHTAALVHKTQAVVPSDWTGAFSSGFPSVSAQGLYVQVPNRRWFTTIVATFQATPPDGAPLPSPLAFKAFINWGDGTKTAGHAVWLVPGGDIYAITSSHRYGHSGVYNTLVNIYAWPPGTSLAVTRGYLQAG